ncbi:Kri1-C domain-containing protein [Mycena kentingensis (nom. inval.)]|nr:Kri1-C domain-containing protein [Mycena kentingensis (nom. inval.)]
MLSDSESDSERDLHQLTINDHYAKAFEYRKEREELQKLKDQYGSDPDSEEEDETDSESAESEDSDGEELTPAMDAAILRTLARIKRKDPGIYEDGKDIFAEEEEKSAPAASKLTQAKPAAVAPKDKARRSIFSPSASANRCPQSKPLTIRAANLQNALDSRSPSPEPQPLTYVEEQKHLRDETIAAFHAAEGDADEEDWLVPREKTMEEVAKEEEEYREFLEKEVGNLRDLVEVVDSGVVVAEEEETPKKKRKKEKKAKKDAPAEAGPSKSKEEADQDFLVNYILNRGWIDRTAKRLPTYKEITSSSLKKKGKAKADPDDVASDGDVDADGPNDDDDEEEIFDDIVDRFESSYNFRFEEENGAEIKTYPRNLPSAVRREDTTRKDARERRKQRKQEEMAARKEDVKRLKGLKMKEIRVRLERAGVAAGEAESLRDLGIDLDADWDPDAHDKQMAGLYALNGDADADEGEQEEEFDAEKPTWDDDIDIGDIYVDPTIETKKDKKKKKKKKDAEEDDMAVDVDDMDADVVPEWDDDEEWDGTEEMRKRKLKQWMDEIYALDFNDIVGGQSTRFHYASVAPQNYALSASEIFNAKDSELNEYMGIKKYAPYRRDGWDKNRNERLKEFKGKMQERLGGAAAATQDGQVKKKRKGKKERMREKAEAEVADDGEDNAPKKRKRGEPEEVEQSAAVPSEGGSKKKRRRKKKEEV